MLSCIINLILLFVLCFQRFELAIKLKDLRTAYQLAQQIDVRVSMIIMLSLCVSCIHVMHLVGEQVEAIIIIGGSKE